MVTGALLIVVAAGLVAYGVHELQEAGILPFLSGTAYDASSTLSDEAGVGGILRALFGYQDSPSWLEVLAWVGYLAVAGTLFFRSPSRTSEQGVDTAQEAASSQHD